ncbi:F-box domain-containing protein [Aphelenchoides besseyi]|nr:F-box domain-containing protein [Aphelenchoides besseyi]
MERLNSDCLLRIFLELEFKEKVQIERTSYPYSNIRTFHVSEFLRNSDSNYFQQDNINFIPTVCGVISRCGPHLRSLSFDSGWYRVSPPIISTISQYCGQLTKLDLSCTLLSGDLSEILERVSPRLSYFSVDECNLVAEENAEKISRYFGQMFQLQEINLRKCRVNMEHILDLPKTLKCVDLSGIHHMTPDLLTYFLVGHTELEKLTLCPFPGAQFPIPNLEDLSNGLSIVFDCIGSLPKVKHLALGHISYGSDILSMDSLAHLTSLRSLELKECVGMTPNVLRKILVNSQKLESLKIVNCTAMCDYRLLSFGENLKELIVEKTFQICDEDFENLCRYGKLKRLDVSLCDNIDNNVFRILSSPKLKLRKLMFDGCKGLTSDGINMLVTEGKQLLRFLTELDLSHNKNIDNKSVEAIAKKVEKIKRIKKPLVIYASQTSVQMETLAKLSKRVEILV